MNSQTAFNHLSFRSRVIYKSDAVLSLPEALHKLQSQRPILLCSTRMAQTALFEKVCGLLAKFHWVQVIDIPAHSSVETVDSIVLLAQAHQADAFICLGGGSVCDSAKAAALVLAEGAPLAQHASRFTPPSTVVTPDFVRDKLPIVSIPMTASGAEVTPSLGIRTAQGNKLLFWDAALASRVILIDPQANLEMPASVMLSTAMNGLAHCIEGLYSHARSPITDTLALSGLRAFDHAMRAVAKDPNDANARGALLVAAHLSGMVLASARSCLHHAICHVLGATFGIGHGDANAVILPHALRFNAPAVQPALSAMAHNLGLNADVTHAGEKIIQWLNELQSATQVPTRLRDLGVDPQRLGAVAHQVLHERGLAYNPRAVNAADEIENLLHAAW